MNLNLNENPIGIVCVCVRGSFSVSSGRTSGYFKGRCTMDIEVGTEHSSRVTFRSLHVERGSRLGLTHVLSTGLPRTNVINGNFFIGLSQMIYLYYYKSQMHE